MSTWQVSEPAPDYDCPFCGQPIEPLLFDEAGNKVATRAEAIYIIPRQYCPCDAGQAQKKRDEETGERQKWIDKARLLVQGLQIGKYADFRLNTWDSTRNGENSQIVYNLIKEYVDNVISDRTKRWLYLYGPYGIGKTHLAVAAMRQIAAERLWQPRIIVWPQHCSQVKESWRRDSSESGPSETRLWGMMRMARILLIDDIDKADSTSWALQKLYEIIDYRVIHNRPTIITANHSIETLRAMWATSKKEHIRDIGAAILSRIAGQLSTIAEFTGDDQRWAK